MSYNRGAMTCATFFNLCDDLLGESRLSLIGNDTAIIYGRERITYGELRQLVDEWTARLVEQGVCKGDRVALVLYDSPLFVAVFLAGAALSAINVPINTALPPEDIQFVINDSGARLIICETELQAKLDWLKADAIEMLTLLMVDARQWPYAENKEQVAYIECAKTSGESPAFMLYTSGSTGTPKGVLHRHSAPRETAMTYGATVLRLTESDRTYSSSRMFFAYGFGNSLTFPLSAGAAVILDSERPTPERIAHIFAEQKPTVFFGVPAVYRALLDFNAKQPLDTSSLRLCVSAGEALPARIFEDWQAAFHLDILDGIGSTEMLHIFIANHPNEARAGSSGRAVDGYSARLLDTSGEEARTDELGDLWVKGASAFTGYWNRPDLTALTIQDGWVKTGDVYRRDAEGSYYHVGRSDDCFKVSGLWVSPVEVESALMAHPEVVEAAVVSAIGEDGLATARAFVVIRTEDDVEKIIAELKAFVRSQLPRFKVPSEIVVVKSLPRTATGKVQRFKLRQSDITKPAEEQE